MSEYISILQQRRFKSEIQYSNTNSDLNYAKHLLSDKPYVLFIPQEMLIFWHGLKSKLNVSFIDLLPATQALPFVLNKTNELEKKICDLAYLAKRKCHGKYARKKIEALEKCRRLKVCRAEVGVNVSVLVDEVRNKEVTINTLKEEICQLQERCSTLYSELLEKREKRNKNEYEARDCEINIDLLKEENQDLLNYIEHIEQLSMCRNCTTDLENKSSTVSEVGGRQRPGADLEVSRINQPVHEQPYWLCFS